MSTDLIIAAVSVIVSFLIFYKIFSLINRSFSLDFPAWLVIILCLIIAFALYYKRDWFFYSPLTTGATIGFILSILWNIKDMSFLSALLRGIISFRFLFWVVVTAVGILKRDLFLGLWKEYLSVSADPSKPYILILALIVYILGSVFILAPGVLARRRGRSMGLGFNRRSSQSGRVLTQILGLIMVFLGSAFIIDIYTFIAGKISEL